MGSKKSIDELAQMCATVTRKHGCAVYRHVESGTLYVTMAAIWSTDLQVPMIMYSPLGDPCIVFARDFRAFDGVKFERVSDQ